MCNTYSNIIFKLAVLVFITAFLSIIANRSYSQEKNISTDLKFSRALEIIGEYYVDTVNKPQLVEKAIKSMLKELDPHSVYLTKKELDKANETLLGNFEGVGITYQIIKDSIYVISTISEGPSDLVGIMDGDRIIEIDGENSTGEKLNNDYVQKKLRGEKNTKVQVTVFRKSTNEILDFTITRNKIPIYSVDAYFMLTSNIGYIKVNRFAKNTINEYNMGFFTLQLSGMKSLILDLRGNSGGYLKTAINLADEFLKKDNIIVYTEGVNNPKFEYNSSSKGNFEKGKLVVLINEGSASASEIVTGAVQDWDRGIIIGRRSYGKGLVQRPYYLPDGSVIRLTTARYYTPSGRCIQKSYKDGLDKYSKDLTNRFKHGELVNQDSIHFPDSLKYYTNKNRLVYGGGGIMPDIFIPLDTTRDSEYYKTLRKKRILNNFCIEYIDINRKKLESEYPTFEIFNKYFIVNEDFLKDFFEFSKKEGVETKEADFSKSEKYISHQLKALTASMLFDNSKYYQINVDIDDDIHKAIEIINDKKYFKEKDIFYK